MMLIVKIMQSEILSVFPTPGTGEYYIRLKRIFPEQGKYVIYAATGDEIQSGSIVKDGVLSFSIRDNPAGIYFIRLIFLDEIYTARIIHLPN